MKTKIARREFLGQAARGLGFLGVGSAVFESVVAEFFAKAYAQGTAKNSRFYLHFSLPGAPPRWNFDLPLTPNGLTSSNFTPGGFGTLIEKVGAQFRAVYSVEKHVVGNKTIYLPPVWNMKAGGKDFSSLLPHTLFIRGMDMEIDGHALSNSRQLAPIIGGYSLSGMVADSYSRPLPGVSDGLSQAGMAFRSKKGLSPNRVFYEMGVTENQVATLLSPFKDYRAGRSFYSNKSVRLQEQAFQQFEKFAADRGIASSAVVAMYESAMELMAGNIFSISEKWPTALAKYNALVSQALSPVKGTMPGFFDTEIPGKRDPWLRFLGGANDYLTIGDARDMFGATTTAPRMAENFAMAEIMLDAVTSTMTLGFEGLSNLDGGIRGFDANHDQHNMGGVVSVLATTLFYRAFLNCLSEYVQKLKDDKIFDKTVIHIASEFNRIPRALGDGSDHGVQGSNATLISGMLSQMNVIGNIKVASHTNVYRGTYGHSMPYKIKAGDPDRAIQVSDVARTITSMLAVDDIVTNGQSLLDRGSNGLWVVRKDEANNV